MLNYVKCGLLSLALLVLISCGKEKSIDTLGTTGNPSTATGVLKMTINGKPWVADRFAFASIQQGFTSVYGQSQTGKSLIITLTTTSTGEFQLDQTSLHAAAWTDSTEATEGYTTNQGNSTADAGGRVFLTKIDTVKMTISGTFQFNLFRELDNGKKIVVDGVFENLYYGTPGSNTGGTGNTGGGSTTGNSMSATIDGGVYTPKRVVGLVYQDKLMINGSEPDGIKAVGFQLPVAITAGTYDLSSFGDYVALYNVSITESYAADSGKLIILEHNKSTKKIRGTFEFNGVNLFTSAAKKITGGAFTVNY